MKRVIQILLGYAVFCLLGCFIYKFFIADIPLLLQKTETAYRFLGALKLFCKICPSIIITGFVVGYAVSFGRNPEGSERRFSSAMFKRYRQVVGISLACSFLLTVIAEIGFPVFEAKQRQYVRMPVLLNEYIKVGQQMQQAGRNALAYQYGELAAKIDPTSVEAARLMKETEVAAISAHSGRKKNDEVSDTLQAVSEEGYTVSELRRRAENAYAAARWFDAHYYAQTGVSISNPRNTNYERLREIAANSWNKLAMSDMPAVTESEKIFARKMEGYTAFMQGDNLRAYYIFHTLSTETRELSRDPDVVRYLALVTNRLENETFFIDEIIDAQGFETAADVYFSLVDATGVTDIVYIKGVTPVQHTAGMVQYLRGLSIFSLDMNGAYVQSVYAPYAKMLEVPASDFDDNTSHMLGIADDVAYIPYILLRSIDRDTEGITSGPRYQYASDKSGCPDQIVLPVSYDDFLLLCDASQGADYMGLISLLRFVSKAKQFGYSEEVFAQVLLNRMLYPLFMLIILIVFASFAWNYRIGEHLLFKASYIFVFPFCSLLAYMICMVLQWLYKLVNYVFIGAAGSRFSLFLGSGVYVIVLIISSVIFLARSAADEA